MIPETAFLALVFAAAALMHGMVGIGVTLIPTAVLALEMEMKQVLALTMLPMLVINASSVIGGSPVMPILKRYTLLAFACVVGSYAGTKLLLILPSVWLQLFLVVLIGAYIMQAIRGVKLKLSGHPSVTVVFGFLAGVAGGAANAMSSVLLMYLLTKSNDKNEISQAGNLCFALTKIVQIIVLWPLFRQMQISSTVLITVTVVALVALGVGVWLRQKISFHQFRKISLTILAILALMMLYKSLRQIWFQA